MLALLDGNNFFVSAERSVRPSLCDKPVVVLGSNDGCVVARSNEAKDLGIKMGQPWFQIRHLEDEAGVIALSANFELIGEVSTRMMSLASGLGPDVHIASVDECFVDVGGVRNITARANAVRERIYRWVGVPCCVGIASTPTLSKLANHVAKSAERRPGSYPPHLARVCNFAELRQSELDEIFANTDVGEVWGIGRRIGKQLNETGIMTVKAFLDLSPALVRARWGVVLERTLRELQGQRCVALDDMSAARQQIACTRSFGSPIQDLQTLIQAVSEFITKAAEKLRRQDSYAGQVLVFAHTSPFRPGPRFSESSVTPLLRPTADTALLIQAAVAGAKRIFRPGFDLSKAGIMLLDLGPSSVHQGELLLDDSNGLDRSHLMGAVDVLNERYGKGTVHVASTGQSERQRVWAIRQDRRTPCATTRLSDIPVVRA